MKLRNRINSFIWEKLIPFNIKERMGILIHNTFLGSECIEYIRTKDGFSILPDKSAVFGRHVFLEYQFDDIRMDDIVIDIGAHVGSFTLRAAKLSNQVHAFEPLYTDILQKNVDLNPDFKHKITVHEIALGDGNPIFINFEGREKTVRTLSLKDIISICGGCDFLKCDAEGAEYIVPFEEFKGIRRIELEAHNHDHMQYPFNQALIDFILSNWDCTIHKSLTGGSDPRKNIHAYPKRSSSVSK